MANDPNLTCCPAAGCSRRIPRSYAFCRFHWYALPRLLRDRIWRLYLDEPGAPRHLQALEEARRLLDGDASVSLEKQ